MSTRQNQVNASENASYTLSESHFGLVRNTATRQADLDPVADFQGGETPTLGHNSGNQISGDGGRGHHQGATLPWGPSRMMTGPGQGTHSSQGCSMMTAAVTRKEPVIFSQVVEALFKHAFKERLDTHTRARLKKIGIDLDHPFLVAYSVPTWFAAVGVCSEVLFPDVSNEQARYRIGRKLVDGYGQTTMGRAVFAMLRMLGWERSLGPHLARAAVGDQLPVGPAPASWTTKTLEVIFEVMPEFQAALGTHARHQSALHARQHGRDDGTGRCTLHAQRVAAHRARLPARRLPAAPPPKKKSSRIELEVGLGRAALGAVPVFGELLEGRARRDVRVGDRPRPGHRCTRT